MAYTLKSPVSSHLLSPWPIVDASTINSNDVVLNSASENSASVNKTSVNYILSPTVKPTLVTMLPKNSFDTDFQIEDSPVVNNTTSLKYICSSSDTNICVNSQAINCDQINDKNRIINKTPSITFVNDFPSKSLMPIKNLQNGDVSPVVKKTPKITKKKGTNRINQSEESLKVVKCEFCNREFKSTNGGYYRSHIAARISNGGICRSGKKRDQSKKLKTTADDHLRSPFNSLFQSNGESLNFNALENNSTPKTKSKKRKVQELMSTTTSSEFQETYELMNLNVINYKTTAKKKYKKKKAQEVLPTLPSPVFYEDESSNLSTATLASSVYSEYSESLFATDDNSSGFDQDHEIFNIFTAGDNKEFTSVVLNFNGY